jgi:hypothetical protein
VKFLLVSDLHASKFALDALAKSYSEHLPDAVLVAGDLTTFGPAGFVDELAALGVGPILAVTGNCDTPEVRERMAASGIDACDRLARLGSVDVAGVAWRGRKRIFEGVAPSLATELAGRDRSRTLLILSHCPAHGILDEASPGSHAGSGEILELAVSSGAAALLTGHVHEARGIVHRAGKTFVNAGPAKDGRAALVRVDGRDLGAELI